jgi:hypothetical protein
MWKTPRSFCTMRVAPHIDIKCPSAKSLDASPRPLTPCVVNVSGGGVVCR